MGESKGKIDWSRAWFPIFACFASLLGIICCLIFHLSRVPLPEFEVALARKYDPSPEVRFAASYMDSDSAYAHTQTHRWKGQIKPLVEELEHELKPQGFVLSTLFVRETYAWTRGDITVLMTTNQAWNDHPHRAKMIELTVSRKYAYSLPNALRARRDD
jgi:hypothetical protein